MVNTEERGPGVLVEIPKEALHQWPQGFGMQEMEWIVAQCSSRVELHMAEVALGIQVNASLGMATPDDASVCLASITAK